MTHEPKTFVVADPRTFEGDPYEVAERTFKQAEAIARILEGALDGCRLMARNAEMTRTLDMTNECDAQAFEQTVLAKQIDALREQNQRALTALPILRKAAIYNPKAQVGRD